jgi:Na+/proline symporter
MTAGIAVLYLLGMLAVGLWAARRTRNAGDYFVAGRSLGLWVTGLAAMSAAFSGFVFMGGPGLMGRIGVGSLFIVIPVGFTAALICRVMARRLRLLAEVRTLYTIPDAIQARYDSRVATGLSAVAVRIGAIGYLGVQILAAGRLIEVVFHTRESFGAWSLPLAVFLGLTIVLIYSVAGGMLAGVYTDLIQGALMMVVAMVVFGYALSAGGGWNGIVDSIAADSRYGESFLNPLGRIPLFQAFGFFFVFGIGALGQPHVLHKFYMLKDPRQLRWMPWIFGGGQSLCLLIWLGVGLVVPALVAQGKMAIPERLDDTALLFLTGFTPELVAGLALAGVMAAIMSTSDSFVNIGAAALVRDLPKALGRTPATGLTPARIATVAIGLAAACLALWTDDLIALLGSYAFGIFAAGLTPVLAVGLHWKRVTPAAAAASIAVGTLLSVAPQLVTWLPWADGVMPSAVALCASFLTLFVVTLATRPAALAPDVAAVMEK